jgi:hypothetical protein
MPQVAFAPFPTQTPPRTHNEHDHTYLGSRRSGHLDAQRRLDSRLSEHPTLKYQHYAVFSAELERYDIPPACAGPILYSYWECGKLHSRINIEQLIADLDSGAIARKRGFGPRTISRLKEHFLDDDEAVYSVGSI